VIKKYDAQKNVFSSNENAKMDVWTLWKLLKNMLRNECVCKKLEVASIKKILEKPCLNCLK